MKEITYSGMAVRYQMDARMVSVIARSPSFPKRLNGENEAQRPYRFSAAAVDAFMKKNGYKPSICCPTCGGKW